jgi:hypothetical protein
MSKWKSGVVALNHLALNSYLLCHSVELGSSSDFYDSNNGCYLLSPNLVLSSVYTVSLAYFQIYYLLLFIMLF